ncbi:hypothetical protein AAC387_Pa01g0526 [Persea americana]
MDSVFFEMVKMVGAQTIIDMMNKAWGQLNHYRNLNENVEKLKSEIEGLSCQMEDVEEELRREEILRGKKRKSEVALWLQNVKKTKNEVHSIEEELQGQRWISRYSLAPHVEKKITKVVNLKKEGIFSNGLVVDPMTDVGVYLLTTPLVGQTTAKKALETIWNSLKDVKIGKIGVYGMGGVGKTTIMKHINNHLKLKEAQLFDSVIWVTVSKELSLERLQTDISKGIQLNFSEDDDEVMRSAKLCAALMRRKKFVLILDDMWEAFPLERVGIPEPNQDNGYKIVFTTRDQRVCRRMETHRNIKVEVLSDEEAWDLFKDKVGGDEVLSPDVQGIAKNIVRKCGGLPIAIITVGRALRQVFNVKVWENALYELKCSSAEIKGMDGDVTALLKFSYERLRNDQVKACFQYCALYPEDYEISTEELIEHWMGEGFIDEMRSREARINKGQAILAELIDTCLLETAEKYLFNRVKMHDLIRDLAISITRVNPLFIVKAGVKLKEEPKDDEWIQNVDSVSLMSNDLKRLSGQPNCPKLSTLLLHQNSKLVSVSNSFFQYMLGLKVLNLSNTRIDTLPTSLSDLENLHTLLLEGCYKLTVVPTLEKLKKLRVLNLSGASIRELPLGIEQLVNLKCLDLSHTTDLMIFQAGVMPNLSFLEDFSMYGSSCKWSCNNNEGNRIDEIIRMEQLVNLKLVFEDLRSFSKYVEKEMWRELKSFHFLIRASWLTYHVPPSKFFIEISHDFGVFENENLPLFFPDNTLRLDLIKYHKIHRLSQPSVILSNVTKLEECHVKQCLLITCILKAEEDTLLPTLQRLVLDDLPRLTTLCEGVMPLGTLACLKVIEISECPELKYVFQLGLLLNLQNLEEITVRNCGHMEKLMAEEGDEKSEANNNNNRTITLPKLRQLKLTHLPKLKSICKGVLICDSLHTIEVSRCYKLNKIPLSISNRSSVLEGNITGKTEWLNALEWFDLDTKELLQPLLKDDKE